HSVSPRRIVLERAREQARSSRGGDDLPEAARAFVEVVLAPVHQAVYAERDGVLVEQQEIASGPDGGGDASQPRVEIPRLQYRPGPCVDEIEASTAELRGQRLRIRLNPENRRPALAGRLEGLSGGVDAGDDRPECRELGCRFARSAL